MKASEIYDNGFGHAGEAGPAADAGPATDISLTADAGSATE